MRTDGRTPASSNLRTGGRTAERDRSTGGRPDSPGREPVASDHRSSASTPPTLHAHRQRLDILPLPS